MDKWETYDGDHLVSIAFDSTHRGTPDPRLIYGASGVARLEVDPKGTWPLRRRESEMTSVLYLGCPAPERAAAEKQLGDVDVAVVWGENASFALTELRRRNMPVLLDLSKGAAALPDRA